MIGLSVWVDIPGYEGLYQASRLGEVRSLRSSRGRGEKFGVRVLKGRPNDKGYLRVTLCRDGVKRDEYVHRLVLLAFQGPPRDGYEAGHLNGVRSDNRIENLSWVTGTENASHRILHGTAPSGERHGGRKITAAQAAAIRAKCSAGMAQRVVAGEFGISQSQVSHIARGLQWRAM
jgi:hypothetical protein